MSAGWPSSISIRWSPGHTLLVRGRRWRCRVDGASLAENASTWRLDKAIRAVTGYDAVTILLRDGAPPGRVPRPLAPHSRHNGDAPHRFAPQATPMMRPVMPCALPWRGLQQGRRSKPWALISKPFRRIAATYGPKDEARGIPGTYMCSGKSVR